MPGRAAHLAAVVLLLWRSPRRSKRWRLWRKPSPFRKRSECTAALAAADAMAACYRSDAQTSGARAVLDRPRCMYWAIPPRWRRSGKGAMFLRACAKAIVRACAR